MTGLVIMNSKGVPFAAITEYGDNPEELRERIKMICEQEYNRLAWVERTDDVFSIPADGQNYSIQLEDYEDGGNITKDFVRVVWVDLHF